LLVVPLQSFHGPEGAGANAVAALALEIHTVDLNRLDADEGAVDHVGDVRSDVHFQLPGAPPR